MDKLDNIENINGAELLKPLFLFRATGNTYPYKEDFIAWGWNWNKEKRRWEIEAGDAGDICIRAMMKKQGVIISVNP